MNIAFRGVVPEGDAGAGTSVCSDVSDMRGLSSARARAANVTGFIPVPRYPDEHFAGAKALK
jgi:hypothetical protein